MSSCGNIFALGQRLQTDIVEARANWNRMRRLGRLFCNPSLTRSRHKRHRQLSWPAALLLCWCLRLGAAAQPPAPVPVLLDNMDGPQISLRLVNGMAGLQIVNHAIDQKTYRFGSGSEHLRLTCPSGHSAQLAYNVPPAPVIEELRIRASVWCNRPGIRLAATVVLPRTKNVSTAAPFELLLRGNLNGQVGNWQQLSLDNITTALERQARVARMRLGSDLDERGAYVSQIILLVPGGPGVSEIAVDRIEVFGVVGSERRGAQSVVSSPAGKQQIPARPNFPIPESHSRAASSPPIASDTLRIIQWQGEPFEVLAQLGFDAVGMGRLPTTTEAGEANRLGLSLVCPPPTPRQLTAHGIGDEFSAVSVWNLGEQVSPDELELANRWQQLLARHDTNQKRPTLISAPLYTHEASRIADRVLVERPLLSSGLTLRDYSTWLAGRQRLVRPGTPIWTAVETQLSLNATRQVAALFPTAAKESFVSYAQILGMTSAALGARSRGFYFRSHSSLAKTDLLTRRRRFILELVNLRLGLAKPWLSNGKILAGARSTVPDLTALVLQAERSYLLVPVHWSDTFQGPGRRSSTGPVSFLVPGVAESSEAYLLTAAGPQRLRRKRVTGGIRVSVDQLPHDAFLLLTDDQQAFSQVTRYLSRHAARTARIRRELAALRLEESVQVTQRLGSELAAARAVQLLLGQARRELHTCDQTLAGQDLEQTYRHTSALERTLDQCEVLLQSELHPPREYGLTALPDQLRLQRALRGAQAGENRLVGGGFEDLPAMLQSGWRHQQLPLEGITSAVRLSPEAPHRGAYCLELQARPSDESAPPTVVPTAPVWISSAPIQVAAGDLVEITGVARLPAALLGSVDGLQLIDSLGGPEMALRLPATPSWSPFRVLRAASTSGEVSVTIALTGFGKAQVDDVAVRILPNPSASVGPQTATQARQRAQ